MLTSCLIRRTVAEIPNLLYLLMTTMVIKMSLTVITFGCTVPGGIFLPSLIIGAITGRVIGLIMQYLTLTYPNAWPFTACAQDLATRGECVIPGVYAIVGAAAGLAGVTRTTSKCRSCSNRCNGVLILYCSFSCGHHVWIDLFSNICTGKSQDWKCVALHNDWHASPFPPINFNLFVWVIF